MIPACLSWRWGNETQISPLLLLPLIIVLTGCPFFNKIPVWETIPNLIMRLGDPVSFSLSTYCADPD
jgi:hypothetical protein